MIQYSRRTRAKISKILVIVMLGSMLTVIFGVTQVIQAPIAQAAVSMTNLANIPIVNSANGISVSSDGTKLVLITGNNSQNNGAFNAVYTSADSGATWTPRTIPTFNSPLVSVVSSSTGQYVVVTTRKSSAIMKSSDYGATWTSTSLSGFNSSCNGSTDFGYSLNDIYSGIAMSTDGSVVALQVFNSFCLLISKDSGANFSKITLPSYGMYRNNFHLTQSTTTTSNYGLWFAKAEDVVGNGGLWRYDFSNTSVSTLTTGTWTTTDYRTILGDPKGITGSTDGTTVYTAGNGKSGAPPFTGSIWKSTNGGANFTAIGSTSKNWLGIKSSADGTKIIGWADNEVWVSADSGVTWTYQGNPTIRITNAVFSADGSTAYVSAGDPFETQSSSKVWKFSFPANTTTSLAVQFSPQVYGETTTLTATINSASATGTVNFKKDGVSIDGCGAVTVTSGSAVCTFSSLSVGTYTNRIMASYSGGGNYAASDSGFLAPLTITKASLNVLPTATSVAFGGTPTYAKTYSGFVNNDSITSSSFTTGLTPPTCAAVSYTTSTSVSSSPLSITCSGGSSTNYTFTYASTSNLTITQATPTVSLALSASTPTYGAIDTITATASVPGVVDFKVGGVSISGCGAVSTAISAPYTAQCLWIPGAASTSYSLTASVVPTNTVDYTSANSATTSTPSSSKAAITVTPTAGQSKVYGANNPTIAYTITSGTLIGSDILSGSLTFTGTNVGNYTITIGTLANSSYTITLASVTFAITQATQNAVTLSSLSSSYNPSNKTVALTGSGGSGTGGYTYLLDASNTTPGCSVSGSTLTYTTAGTCVIAVTRSSDTNFLARTDVVSFSVGLASQTISFASLSAKSYSSDTFTVSATSSASLTVVFTSGSPLVCTTSGSNGSVITLLGVGTCVINANQIGDSNTSAASQVSQNFTVNPRAITVTADAKTKVFGATDPSLTYAITSSSLLLGDALTGTLTRASGTDSGTYQIQAGTLTSSNNPKYAITYVAADLTITRATPTLVLTYPNNSVAILRPGAVDTPTVTTSSSSGALTFATGAASSICTVDATTGVISLFGAGSCAIAMTTAQTTNYIQYTETTTVTVALLSTSLTGINQSNLVSMGNPFYAHASIDQSYSFSSGSNGASVAIPAGALDANVPISIHLLADSTDQRTIIGGSGTSVLSVVVSWVASDGSVPSTNTGKAISVTLTNPSIKSGAKIYSIIGNLSTLLGTATADGSITSLITEDPVLLVINPVVTTPAPSSSSSGSSGGGGFVMATVIDNSAAIEAANLKLAADKAAAELKAAQDKKAAEEAEAAAIKAAKDLADAQAQAAAELKAFQDKAAEELRIAEELRLAQLKAEADLKFAAEKKALADFATAARNAKSAVTLYSVSPSLKLNSYDSAYLAKYVNSLKNGASVTCIGYTYGKSPASKASQTLAKRQASAVCSQMKKTNKTLKTSIVIYPASKAPKAAAGAKWVGVSYRIDGFKE